MNTSASLSVLQFARAGFFAALGLFSTASALFAANPNTGGTSTVAFGGVAIPGGAQSTSYVISSSGSYYLAGERVMTASVPAIVVNAPDVTVDLNGATIRYTSTAVTKGIELTNWSNVEIRNGTITDVPGIGISAYNGSGLTIKNVRITACAGYGIEGGNLKHASIEGVQVTYCGGWGIYVFPGESIRVVGSISSHNGGSGIALAGVNDAEVTGCIASYNAFDGIGLTGTGGKIVDNLVGHNNSAKNNSRGGIHAGEQCFVRGNTLALNYVSGIEIGSNCVVEGNAIIYTLTAAGTSGGYAVRRSGGSSGSLFVNNRLSTGSVIDSGIQETGNIVF